MCFKKKKEVKEEIDVYIEDRKTILLTSQEIDILIELDRNKVFKPTLLTVQEELKYLSPRDNVVVYEIDKKIRDKIGELRLLFNKLDGQDKDYIESLILEIKVLIKERNAKEIK
jgi:hypothetical protein